MKKFILEEMLLMAQSERTARKIKFHPKTTVILGANDTGKSSLVKSIFWTFGADPAVMHPEWKKLGITSFIRFTVNQKKYSILRQGNFFALFDDHGNLIKRCTSVTKELGPELSKIFEFDIKILNRSGEEVTPPPAYYLLPFYVDQDKSWTDAWAGFSHLDQLPKWRSPIIEYHAGLKDNDDYRSQSEKGKINVIVRNLNSERIFYQKTLEGITNDEETIDFNFDLKIFKNELERLIKSADELGKLEEKLKSDLVSLSNEKNLVDHQINIVDSVLNETKNDYKYALGHADVECPTCGQHYTNSFSERFSIAKDEYRCSELLGELQQKLIDLNLKIEVKRSEYDLNHEEVIKVNNLLSTKRGVLTLREIIESEGRKQLKSFLYSRLGEIESNVLKLELSIKDIEKEQKIKQKKNREKKIRIHEYYLQKMREYLSFLGVNKLVEDEYKKINFRITETGSDRPRALLAYYYVVLSLINEFSSAVFAPIIIDSPKQQDPDDVNWKKILQFIRDKQVSDSQLILTLSDLGTSNFDGEIIELTQKHRLLLANDYKKIFEEISPFLNKSLLEGK